MARIKLAKTLVLSLLWAIFLSLLITNWDALKSMQWQDLSESVKISDIWTFLKQHADDIFFFGLCFSFISLLLSNFIGKNGRTKKRDFKRDVGISSMINGKDGHEVMDPAGGIIVRGLDIDISIDPGLTSMPSNVYHRWYASHQTKREDQ